MRKVILLLFILFNVKGFSQKSEVTPEMSALVDKNVAVFGGNEHKEYRKLDREFAKKIPVEASFSYFNNDFTEWVTANLSKTHFKSVEEAVDLFDRMNVSHRRFIDKLSELDQEQNRVIKQYGDEEKFNEIFSNEFGKRLELATK